MGSGLWVKLDASYYLDAAILDAGEAAEVLFLRGLALAKCTNRDGLVTHSQLNTLGLRSLRRRIEALVRVGLWIPVDGGWQIRSWLSWNNTAQRVAEIRELRVEAGKMGGRPKQIAKQIDKQSALTVHNPEESRVEVENSVVDVQPSTTPAKVGRQPFIDDCRNEWGKWVGVNGKAAPKPSLFSRLKGQHGENLVREMLHTLATKRLAGGPAVDGDPVAYFVAAVEGEARRRAVGGSWPAKSAADNDAAVLDEINRRYRDDVDAYRAKGL